MATLAPPPSSLLQPTLMGPTPSISQSSMLMANQQSPIILLPPPSLVSSPAPTGTPIDPESAERINKLGQQVSLFHYKLANEPSLGLYYVQDNILRSVPKLVDNKKKLKSQTQKVEEAVFDVEYSLRTVKALHNVSSFQNVKQMLDRAIVHGSDITKRRAIRRQTSVDRTTTTSLLDSIISSTTAATTSLLSPASTSSSTSISSPTSPFSSSSSSSSSSTPSSLPPSTSSSSASTSAAPIDTLFMPTPTQTSSNSTKEITMKRFD
eukprot:TRINITY_DN10835_c0_g1_i1.p1 TRINITY_DN10835_c0_g1~~TRINITY_DN10835_c0_g1_i1.p1  ORF type:complete len:265 (+),score=70.83 TRINITY_DN10835_c0_g1_i1:55-849(+)